MKTLAKIIIVATLMLVSVQAYAQWTGPTEAPPGGNRAAPVNVGNASQSKSGLLSVGGLISQFGATFQNGDLRLRGGNLLFGNPGEGLSGFGTVFSSWSPDIGTEPSNVTTPAVGEETCGTSPTEQYQCSASSPQEYFTNGCVDVFEDTVGGITTTAQRDILCLRETAVHTVREKGGILEFLNNAGNVVLNLTQGGNLCFGSGQSDCSDTWQNLGADDWGTQTVQTADGTISGDGTSGSPLDVNTGDAAFNGWDKDASDDITSLTAGNGISVSGTTISADASACPSGEVLTFTESGFSCVSDQTGSPVWSENADGTVASRGRATIDSAAADVIDPPDTLSEHTRISADSFHTNGLGNGQIYIEGNDIDANSTMQIGHGNAGGQTAQNVSFGGNVGIRTDAAAGASLTVSGDTGISGSLLVTNNQDSSGTTVEQGVHVRGTGDSYFMGNVGIGTNNPGSKLSVLGGVTLQRPEGANVPAGPGPQLAIESPSSGVSTRPLGNGFEYCGSSPSDCAEGDSTPTGNTSAVYECTGSNAGNTYHDVAQLGGGSYYYESDVQCLAGVSSYSLRTNDGTLEFLNNSGTPRVLLSQDGTLVLGENSTQSTGALFANSVNVSNGVSITGPVEVGNGSLCVDTDGSCSASAGAIRIGAIEASDAAGEIININREIDIDSSNYNRGIFLDGRQALTGYSGNAWLRLNQGNQFANGVYTPGDLRADGDFKARNNIWGTRRIDLTRTVNRGEQSGWYTVNIANWENDYYECPNGSYLAGIGFYAKASFEKSSIHLRCREL